MGVRGYGGTRVWGYEGWEWSTCPLRRYSQCGPLPGSSSAVLISYSMMPKEKISAAVDGLASSRSRLR